MKAILGTALAMSLAAAASAMAQTGGATLHQPDQDFLTKASEGNISEIKLGELAVHKANNPQVKQFAQRMVDDHTKAQDQLTKDMTGSNVVVSDHMTKDAAGLYDKLAKESGADFDKDYMNAMVNDHQDDVNAFNDEVKNGKNEKLRAYAQNTLPTLQQHLQSAKQINQQVAQNEKK
jgi:putative membrane protein